MISDEYLLVVRRNDETKDYVTTLGVFPGLESALSFVIEQHNQQHPYLQGGTLPIETVHELDGLAQVWLPRSILLYSNRSHQVVIEKSTIHAFAKNKQSLQTEYQ